MRAFQPVQPRLKRLHGAAADVDDVLADLGFAGADQGATGESAIRHQCKSADIIVGVVGILHANAMLGEISPAVALAVGLSDAHKVLIPLERCGLTIAGVARQPLDALIADAAARVAALAAGNPCQTETQERT